MMYKVTIINNSIETVIHSSHVNDLKLASGTIKKGINLIDSFQFALHINNPGYGKIKPLTTLVSVLNMKTGKYEFEGRILGPSESMDEKGLIDVSYECEGELGYLHDSQQRYLEFTGTPQELMQILLDYHNSQVETYKHFQVGNVEITDNLYLYLSAEKTTFDNIKEKLIDKLGGELQVRKENGVRFLDYLVRIGEDKNTEIRIAKNLLSMSRDVDPTKIITRLTPLGGRVADSSEVSQPRLTIESVNGGLPYIDDPTLIAEFGIQGGTVTWDDVTEPSNLLSKGQEWLSNQKTAHVQYQIGALDLFLIGLDFDSFETGNSYPVKNPLMSIDERLRIIGKSLDILSPHKSSLTIGDKFKSLHEYQSDLNQSAQKVIELENTVSLQSKTISSLKTELDSVDSAIITINQALEENDIPALQQAVSDLETAIDNLNTAIDEIPDYQPATSTSDGLMSSTDKNKIDLLSVSTGINLDQLKSKLDLISVLNSIDLDSIQQKVNLITVINAVDLDNLVSRVEALEGGA